MITLEPTTDLAWLNSVLHDPSVWPWIVNDEVPDVSAEELIKAGVEFVAVLKDGTKVGAFALHPEASGNGTQMHTCLLPSCRGRQAVEAGRLLLTQCLRRPECRAVTGFVPDDNRAAGWFARRIGLEPTGRLEAVWPRHGQKIGITLYRKEKPCPL